ncbi:hypothetical protein [Dyella silvatica]|uniref:hypothetical protein n=1 Tax=Dyella silvatica TaxID=2992128 RepID=UPI002252A676|nr:hypothetical protein [Dyella silvatica]
MIGNEQVAKQISELMLEYGARLDESIILVMENCPEDEFKRYRMAAGRILGEMLLEIMNPLYAKHPDLKPAGLI